MFQQWVAAGVFLQLWQTGLERYDELKGLDWSWLSLASGGQEGDLKELGGWENYAMVSRYAKANAGERAIAAHKKLSPGDRLNVR